MYYYQGFQPINLSVIRILNSVYKRGVLYVNYIYLFRSFRNNDNRGVLLEKHFVKNDHVTAAKLLSDGMYHGMRIGGVCCIGYVFIKILIMF